MIARRLRVVAAGNDEGDEDNPRRIDDAEVIRDVFEAMPSPMAAVAGPEHTVVAANAACRAAVRRADLIGGPAWQLFPAFPRQQITELLTLVYAAGEPFTARRLPVADDLFLDFTLTPWHAAGGGIQGVLVTLAEAAEPAAERPAPLREARSRVRREAVVVYEAMLPSGLPVFPQARIAARCLPAPAADVGGGDWFDAFPLPGGRVALMLGELAERGVAASAAMGRLRAVFRHALTLHTDLPAVLDEADRFAAGDAALTVATLCVAVLDAAGGEFRYATCGHPPPLLVAADGTARFLPGTGGRPLAVGASSGLSAVPRSACLQPGEVLLLYTDGLVERPGRARSDGMADLAIVAGDAVANRALAAWATGTPAERASQLTVELLTRAGYGDDVTTVAAWRQPAPTAALDIELLASPDAARTLRHALSDWLAALGVALGDRQLAELAVAEALANAVEHAYPPGAPGPVRLEAEVGVDGYLHTRVSDRGRWRVPDTATADRGQGLSVAVQFAEELQVSQPARDAGEPPGPRGTAVAMRHQLRRQPMIAPLAIPPPAARTAHPPFAVKLVASGPAPRVRVSGPVDLLTADRLTARLFAACRAGMLPLTVDLSAVTVLAGAGVRVLYRVGAQLARHERELTLVSDPGSPAAAVLDLAGLQWAPR
jgi:anti-sigma regulatory factor (Ser/Thr protein kinase)